MIGVILFFMLLSFALPGDTASDYTALKFPDEHNGTNVIYFNPDMSSLSEKFSFCLWMRRLPSSGSGPVIFAYEKLELFLYAAGELRLLGVTMELSSENTPKMEELYHYCCTWSYVSRTYKVYMNGILVGTKITASERKLLIGGTLVLGDFDFEGHTNGNHFGGEMFNFNFFSKELTETEIAALSNNGLCTLVPGQLDDYRVIRWEDMLKIARHGNIQDIEIGCGGKF